MQSFNFGLRQSAATNYTDDNRSRYVPSSIYSGPGPAEESPLPQFPFPTDRGRDTYQERQRQSQPSRFSEPARTNPRSSSLLNVDDPVAMHLLMETAISDSREYQIFSYEEVEQLKKDKVYIRHRIEAARRKLALESKLRDAAQSLNRLYTGRGRPESIDGRSGRSASGFRKSLLGPKHGSNDSTSRAEDEFAASTKKVEEYQRELTSLEKQLDDNQRRILEHTAGILQRTHRGLKKNIRRNDLPRSPESMASHQRGGSHDLSDEFDERSLYQVPEYVMESGHTPTLNGHHFQSPPLDDIAERLYEMSNQMYSTMQHFGVSMQTEPPPQSMTSGSSERTREQIQAHFKYVSRGLDEIATSSSRSAPTVTAAPVGPPANAGSGRHLEDINERIHDILERTNANGNSPLILQDQPRGGDLNSQLQFSSMVLDTLNRRVGTLIEQKEILTRQIQQQRELNSKSDAERDAHIRDLSEQLQESRGALAMEEQEAVQSREHVNLLMDQLDQLQDEKQRTEQQKGSRDSSALRSERESRRESEKKLVADIELHQRKNEELQKTLAELQQDSDTKSQDQVKHVNDLFQAKERADIELQAHKADAEALATQMEKLQQEHEALLISHENRVRELLATTKRAEMELSQAKEEMEHLESEVVRVQTDLTITKAELDSAYGSRAQRAADVSMNPAIQQEIDALKARNAELQKEAEFLSTQHETKGAGSAELQNKVNALQTELRGIMEDYELMTRQSIEFEKDRDQFEETIDTLREKCEILETQMSEDKIKWMGSKQAMSAETTSTMVLKNEFKKMMRDTRAENAKALKVEHDERRRLEGIIRGLKQAAQQQLTPPKTNGIAPTTPEAS